MDREVANSTTVRETDDDLDAQRLHEVMHACTFDNDPLAGLKRLQQLLKAASDDVEAPEAEPCPQVPALGPDGHSSVIHGAPWVRCSAPLGLVFLQDVDPSHPALDTMPSVDDEQRVWVDWDGSIDREEECTLSLRRGGLALAELCGRWGVPLSVGFRFDAAPGETLVAELSWSTGRRHLHILVPVRPGGLPLDDLVALPGIAPRPSLGNSELISLPERGWGIELEVITEGQDIGLKAKAWREMLCDLAKEAKVAGNAELEQWLRRCNLWAVTVDSAINSSPERVARRMVEASSWSGQTADAQVERAMRLLMAGEGTLKTEFKSPAPPNELSFSSGAADELSVFLSCVRYSGAAATTLSPECHSGSSIHIHVNVASTTALGVPLRPDEILAVFLFWVRFDSVTMRFARPWMWREPSMAPLFASGAEFGWTQRAWDAPRPAAASYGRSAYDVPLFLAAVHATCNSPGFAELSDACKMDVLFGPGSPARSLGRYCSLNLCRLSSYGTLEFRRFHGTFDAAAAIRWAHFCVCFVEAFRTRTGIVAEMLEAPLPEGLAAVRASQERATLAELSQLLSSAGFREYEDSRWTEALLRDAVA